ncbi:S-layer homology domain-containing protein [Brachybacterium sp. AOP42-C2-15]|uniref:S-layer homology domain-containing protein n=1 Tax=Brachybacterium sp. AOP42-C2-15 TaxID=3457670 RepID=UPI004034D54E
MSTSPPSLIAPSRTHRAWAALLALLLGLALLPGLGAGPAHAEPLDKSQPGLLSVTDARRALSTMAVDRNGADSGYHRDHFYKSWRVVTAQKGSNRGLRSWYGWDSYTSSTWKEPDVTRALAPKKGCDAREITLIRDAVNGDVRWNASDCKVTGGRWYEAYAGRTTTDASTLDIEHIVAMQDAWNNGAKSWHADQRLQFSHDPLVLAAVSKSENRSKGSRGPAQWKPSNKAAWPAYAQRYISIKSNYDLSLASEAERTALWQMIGGAPAPSKPSTPAGPFKDVRTGQEHHVAMAWMKSAGISKGWPDGTYRPLQPVNRDAMAAFLYRMEGSPKVSLPSRSPFRDVKPGQEHYTAIIWAYNKGITTGWDDGTFRPTQPIDRDAMAAFLYRFAGKPAYSAPSKAPFKDVRKGQKFAREMAWMKSTGISTGWADGTYRPAQPVKRDAMAAFLHRYSKKF